MAQRPGRQLLYLLLAILSFKALLLALDPYPGMMFGDSASYLTTAIKKWIPPDRSFVYGYVLRRLTFRPQTLMPAVILQTFLSGIASWLAAVTLVRFFRARFAVAAVFGFICAIEPLQLMHERYILPDSLSTSLFAVVMFTALAYIHRPSITLLVCLQVLSTLLASFRLNYIPIALILSVVIPLLSAKAIAALRAMSWASLPRAVVLPLVVSIGVSQPLLYGYRELYGYLIDKPPAYSYTDGVFLIGVVVPLLQPEDFEAPVNGREVFNAVQYPLSNPALRPVHHWVPGGLCDTIYKMTNDLDVGNRVMKAAALKAIWRNPTGLLRLALTLYPHFFNYQDLRATLRTEQGQDNAPTPDQAAGITHYFHYDFDKPHFDSLTRLWHGNAVPWYWFLLVFPGLYPLYLIWHRRTVTVYHLFCGFFALMILGMGVCLTERPVTRYLMGEAWLSIVMIGAMLKPEPVREESSLRSKEASANC